MPPGHSFHEHLPHFLPPCWPLFFLISSLRTLFYCFNLPTVSLSVSGNLSDFLVACVRCSVQWYHNCCWVWSIVILYIWNKNCSDEYFNVFIFKSLYRGVDKNPNDVSCLYTHRTYKWAPWRVCKNWQNSPHHSQTVWKTGPIFCDGFVEVSRNWMWWKYANIAAYMAGEGQVSACSYCADKYNTPLCSTEKKPPETMLA